MEERESEMEKYLNYIRAQNKIKNKKEKAPPREEVVDIDESNDSESDFKSTKIDKREYKSSQKESIEEYVNGHNIDKDRKDLSVSRNNDQNNNKKDDNEDDSNSKSNTFYNIDVEPKKIVFKIKVNRSWSRKITIYNKNYYQAKDVNMKLN